MSPTPAHMCPKCGGEVREGWRVCPACAAPLDAATETIFQQSSSSSSSIEEGRFPAGTVLAGRYRILGLLGQGGMGEVYRAYDLILNQAVALKFLPQAQMSEPALARFRNEVRIARQVSHPNVCRVYDIGFVEGLHFLSMEYLDGEDLGSLLRRIGRLPQDKAIEFTRKICAGLSAAHDRGVLHRDLKPSNIMIDGRGQVRITDFGLAALAQEIALGDIRSGTPAYMSPEQKSGKEVTTRSDLYSLGLVIHEMFTGKRRADTQTTPTELVKDLDPAIERVMLRCLEEDPKRRPTSALNVAMALPGGDPIAAALAAGETPSPEMVAASHEKEGFSVRTALICFTIVLIGLAAHALFRDVDTVLRRAPLDIPPDGLAFRAQDLLKQFGYPATPKSTAYGFVNIGQNYLTYLQQQKAASRDALLATHQPAVLAFWYRQHHQELLAEPFLGTSGSLVGGRVSYDLPASNEPGMIRLLLDAEGRLFALEARPAAVSGQSPGSSEFEWSSLFKAAGLDVTRFTPAGPEKTPPMAFDARAAWTGTYAEGRTERLRVEAASWQGRPVYFNITGPWEQEPTIPAQGRALVVMIITLLAGAVAVAWNNFRAGRGDRLGAAKIGGFTFLLMMCAWMPAAAHVAGLWELFLFVAAVSWAGFVGAFIWTLYLAIEPYVRRHWPDALISWTRLHGGRLRDPLVASHILAGMAALMVLPIIIAPLQLAGSRLWGPWELNPGQVASLNSPGVFVEGIFFAVVVSIFIVVGFLLVVILLRLLIRRMWIADVLGAILFGGVPSFVGSSNIYQSTVSGLTSAFAYYLLVWTLRRFGLLATMVLVITSDVIGTMPMNFPSWYAARSLVALTIPAVVAVWALWVIVSAQRRPSTESAA